MNTKGKSHLFLIISVLLVVVLIIVMFYYFALRAPDYTSLYENRIKSGELVNPIEGKSIEEAIADFDDSFVLYILYMIKAYNLHNPPLSSNKPQIEFIIDEEVYSAVVDDGLISVQKRRIDEKDAIIKMGRKEGVKIIRDPSYITKSFENGGSDIELVAEKSTLFSKGYLNLYTEITGKSVTGNVVRIYTD